MNPSDSKKLEEIERRWKGPLTVDQAPNTATLDIVWLIAQLAEQDREIERLRKEAPDVTVTWGTGETTGVNDPMRIRALKAEAGAKELEEMLREINDWYEQDDSRLGNTVEIFEKARRLLAGKEKA